MGHHRSYCKCEGRCFGCAYVNRRRGRGRLAAAAVLLAEAGRPEQSFSRLLNIGLRWSSERPR